MNSHDLELFLSLARDFVGGQFQIFGDFNHRGRMQILAPISGSVRVENGRIICPCSARFSAGAHWQSEPGTDFMLPGNLDKLVMQTLPSGRVMLWFNVPKDETIVVLFPKDDSGGTETFTESLEWDCNPMDIGVITRLARPIPSPSPAPL